MKHIRLVRFYIENFCDEMYRRGEMHDASKLEEPEKSGFDKISPLLDTYAFGSPEYMRTVEESEDLMKHHYSMNRHHPEHFENGIDGMTLFDLVEMYCDWKAAAERKGGDLGGNLPYSAKRFGMSEQLFNIFVNTTNVKS